MPDYAEMEYPDFAGVVRYETSVTFEENEKLDVMLEIADAGEVVQVFINEMDCGIKIIPPFRYEIGTVLHPGENKIAIEVATTLERQIPPKNKKEDWKPQNHVGLCGEVFLYGNKIGGI